jgi:hypothetical protein
MCEREPEDDGMPLGNQPAGGTLRSGGRGPGTGARTLPAGEMPLLWNAIMNHAMNSAAQPVEYRFINSPGEHACPLCASRFATRRGMWPFLAGTARPVCGGDDCPVGEDVTGPSPCNTLFAFHPLAAETLDALRKLDGSRPVAERLRDVSLDDSLPRTDRDLLQRASIDLLFWEANETRIQATDPGLVLQTCGEAAAEMLLSGCGDIL